jgi:hypothetical protein
MPITRKQQVLAKLETTEGGGATFAAGDAVQVFDPTLSDTVEVLDRVPAGPTLSRDFSPVGRKTRQVTFRSDFRGSGVPANSPDFSRLLQACGYKTTASLLVLTAAAVTGSGFQLGEQLFQGASYAAATGIGVIVGILTSANVPKHVSATSGDKIIVAVVSGTLPTATLTTGNSSASTTTISASTAYTGFSFQPTSEKLLQVDTAAWTGGTPAALGEVLAVEAASLKVGAVQVIRQATSYTDMDVTLLWGSIANTNTLRNAAGTGTAVINTVPDMIRTPSLALRHNLDGRDRLLNGSRGDFTLEGEVGQPMQFSWTFTGDPGTDADALATVTTGLGTVRAPRLLGAFCCYGNGSAIYRLPTKKVALNNGGTVSPNLDANRAGGSTGSNVTDRDPSFVVTVDIGHGSFNWEGLRDAGTPVRVGFLLGDTQGNIVSLVAPIGQVTEVALGDSDGVATFDVTIKPLRINESGDDELYITQL